MPNELEVVIEEDYAGPFGENSTDYEISDTYFS